MDMGFSLSKGSSDVTILREAVTQRGQSGHVVIWYFDPYRFVQNLKYKNMKFYKEFEKHAQRGDEEEFYVCNNDVCFAK